MTKLVSDTVFLEKLCNLSETYYGGEEGGCSTSSNRRRWPIFKHLCMLRELKWDLWLWGIKGWWLPGFWMRAEGLALYPTHFFSPFPNLACNVGIQFHILQLSDWNMYLTLAYSIEINTMYFCVLVSLWDLKKKKGEKSEARRKNSNAKSIYKQLCLLYYWFYF